MEQIDGNHVVVFGLLSVVLGIFLILVYNENKRLREIANVAQDLCYGRAGMLSAQLKQLHATLVECGNVWAIRNLLATKSSWDRTIAVAEKAEEKHNEE